MLLLGGAVGLRGLEHAAGSGGLVAPIVESVLLERISSCYCPDEEGPGHGRGVGGCCQLMKSCPTDNRWGNKSGFSFNLVTKVEENFHEATKWDLCLIQNHSTHPPTARRVAPEPI